MTPTQRLFALGLITAMAVGSILLWLGIPVLLLWIASLLSPRSTPTLTSIGLLVFGIPTAMVWFGAQLARLNDLYGDLTGQTPRVRVVAPWHRSVRGARDEGHSRRVLDIVMACSVSLAVLALSVWFLFFASGGGI